MVFLILAAHVMFFLALAVMFYAHQGVGHLDTRSPEFIGDWHPVQLPPILFLNTAVLILSSLTMEIARRRIFRELDVVEEWLGMGRPALMRALPWLAATLVLGGLFVAGQWTGWTQLSGQGFSFDHLATPAVYFFYIITGFHAAFLLLGILALAISLPSLGLLRKVEYRQIAVDSLAPTDAHMVLGAVTVTVLSTEVGSHGLARRNTLRRSTPPRPVAGRRTVVSELPRSGRGSSGRKVTVS